MLYSPHPNPAVARDPDRVIAHKSHRVTVQWFSLIV